MNISLRRSCLSVMLAAAMAVTAFAVAVSVPIVAENPPDDDKYGLGGAGPVLDAALEQRMKCSSGPFEVYVILTDREEANGVLESLGKNPIRSKEFDGLPTVQFMELDSKTIWALADCDGVAKIMTFTRPAVEPVSAEFAKEGFVPDALPAVEDADVNLVHGAVESWDLGFTGQGVIIADIDTGFDMAHPDLQGQQARYTSGTYEGWPMAYDDFGAMKWSQDEIGGWLSDTSTEIAVKGKKASFITFEDIKYTIAGLKDADGNSVKSKSGTYRIGYHPDPHLTALYEAPVAVLVVDAQTAEVYDTVYVDLTHDFTFANDKPCTKGDEIAYFDNYDAGTGVLDNSSWDAGDGFADISGGMIYWIADGETVYPASDWTYGAEFTGDAGCAVAFVGEFYYGESHGTMTSSAALAESRSMGGQLGGMAYGAKLMAIPFTGSVVNAWMFAQYGADGELGGGDDAQICTNSYGYSELVVDAGYNIMDRIAYSISSSGPTMWFWSTGNGGPGYGTCTSVLDTTAVMVGAGTTMQYRYILGYEFVSDYTQWGDVIPFSNSGPSKMGKLGSEIIASGAYSLEPGPLNSYYPLGVMMGPLTTGDGSAHWQFGSGTSHACPTAAGAAALGFQAYYEANGEFPSKHLAKAALMASADDMHYDVFKQAAGWLNAGTFCKLMSGQGGTLSISQGPNYPTSALYPGDVYGTAYEMFPNFMVPGAVDTELVTTANMGDEAVTVDISSQLLLKTDSEEFTVTMKGPSKDALVDITGLVPEDTDLLKVTAYTPMSVTDPNLDAIEDCYYWIELHDWVDLNGNGKMEASASSMASWELFRYTFDGSVSNYNQVMLKDPIDRTNDGLILRIRPGLPVPGTTVNVQLDFYELQEFPWVKFREAGTDDEFTPTLSMEVPGGGQVSWQVQVSVPADAPIGTYGAGIYIDDGSRVQCMPVVVNVPATDYTFDFGGGSYFDTPYNNDIVGVADKWWRFEVGDWRIFWCLPDEDLELPGDDAHLMASVQWAEKHTDVNVHILGPTPADPEDPLEKMFCDYGPGYYEFVTSSSDERYQGDGYFGIYTNTGVAKEVVASPMGACLESVGAPAPFAIVTRCALMAGIEASDTVSGYTKWVTINSRGFDPEEVDASLSDPETLSGTLDAWFDITTDGTLYAKVAVQDPLVIESYLGEEIYQDTLTSEWEEDLANAAYTRVLTLTDCSMLVVNTSAGEDVPDIDLAVWHDVDMDGVADMTEPYWTSGTSSSEEIVTLVDPADGQYLVKVLGYIVMGDPGLFSLTVIYSAVGAWLGEDFEDGPVESGLHEFTVTYSLPEAEGVYVGAVMFGFEGAADLFRTEVVFTVSA